MSVEIPLDQPIPIINLEKTGEYKMDREFPTQLPKQEGSLNLPEPKFKVIDDYELSPMPVFPPPYIQFKPQTNENLFDVVDYDMDEEDMAWLEVMNKNRQRTGLPPVSGDDFEMLIDRFEKESFLHMKAAGQDENVDTHDDANCAVCLEGDYEDTNLILFCDSCDLPVHQDCYGIPYVPEGKWLCRKCFVLPNNEVNCVLCPNTFGALKQTDRGHWAHVLCALWIPEVQFGDTQYMEPIQGIENIPTARFKVLCYLCKQKNVGATIRCQYKHCMRAFHATCAQLKGLHLKFILDGKNAKQEAFCLNHSPMDTPRIKAVTNPQTIFNAPTLPLDKIQDIGKLVSFEHKGPFVLRLIAYWKLKRVSRGCVPLLKRLEAPSNGSYEKFKRALAKLHRSLFFNTSLKLLEKYFSWEREQRHKRKNFCDALTKFDDFFTKCSSHLELSPGNFNYVMNTTNKFMELAKCISNAQIRAQRIQIVDVMIRKLQKTKSILSPRSQIDVPIDSKVEGKHKQNLKTPVDEDSRYSTQNNTLTTSQMSSFNVSNRISGCSESSQENHMLHSNDSSEMSSPAAAHESPTAQPDSPRATCIASHSGHSKVRPEAWQSHAGHSAPDSMEGVEEKMPSRSHLGKSQQRNSHAESVIWNESENIENASVQVSTFRGFETVWAKCQGYSWYPAMIIDPAMPEESSVDSLTIPRPPPDIVALGKKQQRPLHLVCYYDRKRSWEWLPSTKLRRFGQDIDKVMLSSSRQKKVRMEVQKAYYKALKHQSIIKARGLQI